MPEIPKPAQPWIDPVQRIMDLEQQVAALESQLAAYADSCAAIFDTAAELVDIDRLTAEVFGGDVPLRDRVASLVADWHDTTTLAGECLGCRDRIDASERRYSRRGIA